MRVFATEVEMPRDVKHESLDPREAEAKRLQAEADRAALERMYGSPKKQAKSQWGIGVALLVLGPVLIAVGAATQWEIAVIAVGVLALGVGIWALVDGLSRSAKAKAEEHGREG